MNELTDLEKTSMEARNKAAQEMATGIAKKMQAAGGVNFIELTVALQIVTTQVDVLLEMLFESDPKTREDFFNRTAVEFAKIAKANEIPAIVTPDKINRRN